jgi:hypothetical protein
MQISGHRCAPLVIRRVREALGAAAGVEPQRSLRALSLHALPPPAVHRWHGTEQWAGPQSRREQDEGREKDAREHASF